MQSGRDAMIPAPLAVGETDCGKSILETAESGRGINLLVDGRTAITVT
jgi:hypothetical protein